MALFDLSQYLDPNTAEPNSRDGHVAHGLQDLELEHQRESKATEITTWRSETYGKEEEIEPIANVSTKFTSNETGEMRIRTIASSASVPGRRTGVA